jgi:hypothetical protein
MCLKNKKYIGVVASFSLLVIFTNMGPVDSTFLDPPAQIEQTSSNSVGTSTGNSNFSSTNSPSLTQDSTITTSLSSAQKKKSNVERLSRVPADLEKLKIDSNKLYTALQRSDLSEPAKDFIHAHKTKVTNMLSVLIQARSCQDLLDEDSHLTSGYYRVFPEGLDKNPKMVFCEISTSTERVRKRVGLRMRWVNAPVHRVSETLVANMRAKSDCASDVKECKEKKSALKEVFCHSEKGQSPQRCELYGVIQAPEIMKESQSSKSDCRLGQTYGFDPDGIWVADGCSATFKVLTLAEFNDQYQAKGELTGLIDEVRLEKGSSGDTLVVTGFACQIGNPSHLKAWTLYAGTSDEQKVVAAVTGGFRPFIKEPFKTDGETIQKRCLFDDVESTRFQFNINVDQVKNATTFYVEMTTSVNPSDPVRKVANTAYFDVCDSDQVAIGAECAGGAIYAGEFDGGKYMVTPSGCTDSANPTCDGSMDPRNKRWRGSSGSAVDIPGLTNIIPHYITITAASTKSTQRGHETTPIITAHSSIDSDSAAHYCENMTYGGYSDWYLPSKSELAYLYCKAQVSSHNTWWPQEDPDCVAYGGKTSELQGFAAAWYWSSTQSSNLHAWVQSFPGGRQATGRKHDINQVRCVRRY